MCSVFRGSSVNTHLYELAAENASVLKEKLMPEIQTFVNFELFSSFAT